MSVFQTEVAGAIPATGTTLLQDGAAAARLAHNQEVPGSTPGPAPIGADGLVTCRVSKTPRLGAIPGAPAILSLE